MEDEGARGGLEFTWGGVEALARTYDLCATGPAFELALADEDPAIGRWGGVVIRTFFFPSGDDEK